MGTSAVVLVPGALRTWVDTPLAGVALLRRAELVLRRCPSVDRVEVCGDDLASCLAAVPGGDAATVVVHDALHPLAPPDLVDAVLAALAQAPHVAGAVPVRPVTDTLKAVDPDGDLTGTLDRSAYAMPGGPQAYRGGVLRAALERSGTGLPDLLELPGIVLAAGGTLRTVPSPHDDLRVEDAGSLELAEALLRSRSPRDP